MDSNYPVFSGEGNSGDNLLFRGIFVRYFLDMVKQPTNSLYPEKTKNKFIAALRSCSDVLWTLAHPEGYYVGVRLGKKHRPLVIAITGKIA